MEITQVKVFPVHEDKLKAFVSVVFDHCFMINDIKVIQGKDGLFLSMPSRRKKNGEFKDVAHPLNNATRRLIEVHVLREYRQVVDDLTPRRPDRPDEDKDEDEARLPVQLQPEPVVPAVPEPVEAAEPSLEEVQEKHLRDSFWTVS